MIKQKMICSQCHSTTDSTRTVHVHECYVTLRDQIAMSRGLTDVPMIVVGNKTDLLRRDLASDKFRHDVINKVRDETTFITIP